MRSLSHVIHYSSAAHAMTLSNAAEYDFTSPRFLAFARNDSRFSLYLGRYIV